MGLRKRIAQFFHWGWLKTSTDREQEEVRRLERSRVASVEMLRRQIKGIEAVWVKLAVLRMAEKRDMRTDLLVRDIANLAVDYKIDYLGSDKCLVVEVEK